MCLSCRKKNKPKNRNYRCSCSFRFHRDGVGANNIRAKYLGQVPVVGLMARPSGVRFQAHLQCNSVQLCAEESPELLDERRSDAVHGE